MTNARVIVNDLLEFDFDPKEVELIAATPRYQDCKGAGIEIGKRVLVTDPDTSYEFQARVTGFTQYGLIEVIDQEGDKWVYYPKEIETLSESEPPLHEGEMDPEEREALLNTPLHPEFPKGVPAQLAWINHGCEPADYFQGASTLGWDDVYTGSGDTDSEAAKEALDSAAEDGWNPAGIALPDNLRPEYHTEMWVRDNVDPVDIVPRKELHDYQPADRRAAAEKMRDEYLDEYMSESLLSFFVSLKLRSRK
jgi:hypothetical protein